MTDLDDLADIIKILKNSKVNLDRRYWDEQNKNIAIMQKGFEEKRKSMIVSPEKMKRPFDL